MGAGASIQSTDRQGLQGVIEADRARLVDQQQQHHRHTDNMSMRASQRSTTRGSVRAMALMNHARQENSYMSSEVLSSYHRKEGPPADRAADPKIRKFRERGAVAKEPSSNSLNDSKSDQEKSTSSAVQEDAPQPIPPVSRGMQMFRSTLGLKLDVGTSEDVDADWGHASDNDDDGDTLNKFDSRLIEIPEEGVLASPSVLTRKAVRDDVEVDESGALSVNVDGLNVGVGAQGIIRPDRSAATRVGRLPMRERLVILCKLGSGASSAVYKALDLQDMRLVALKTIQVYDKDKRVQLIRELSALFQLIRENSRRDTTMHRQKLSRRPEKYIVDFFDAFSNLEDGVVCLMIEYMDGGSLQDIADQGGCDDESTLANVSIQALKGLSFLHGNLQLHRDLKPANFLISHRGEVKVADLGIMKQLAVTKPGQLPRTNTFVGTASYMSPERIDGKEYSFPSDIWAFGLSLMTLAMGRLPIDTQGGYWTILNSIRDAPPPLLPDAFSPEFRDFVAACLKKKPEERATCTELLKHKFLNKAVPDDLTYNQSYERGRNELLSIVQALVAHLQQLKTDARARHETEADYLANCGVGHERMFGNLYADPISTVLRKILLAEDDKGQQDVRAKRKKSRLATFARQLHLQMDRVQAEIAEFAGSMDS